MTGTLGILRKFQAKPPRPWTKRLGFLFGLRPRPWRGFFVPEDTKKTPTLLALNAQLGRGL